MKTKLKYLTGFSALAISEGLYDMAFVVMAFRISGQASTSAIAYGLGYLAEIIVSLALGGFLDNHSRKKIFSYTILLKCILFALVIGYSLLSGVSALTIWLAAFLADLLHHISRTANTVSLFQIFEGNDKARMQGLVISITGLLRIAGPLLGAATIGFFESPQYVLFLCIVLQFVSLSTFKEILPDKVNEDSSETPASFGQNILASIKALHTALHSQKWRWFFLTDALGTLFIGTFVLMSFPFLRSYHGFSESEAGFMMGIAAIGTIFAGLMFEAIISKISAINGAKVGLLISGIAAMVLTVNVSQFLLAICLVLFNCGSTMFFRSMGMYLQEAVPKENLGVWWTASDAFARIFGFAGIITGGFIFDWIGPFWFSGTMGCLILITLGGFYTRAAARLKIAINAGS